MPTKIPEETEGSLIVLSDTPDIIVTNITDLKEIEAYLLLRAKPEHIHDNYFDTNEAVLQAHRISLRIRRVNGLSPLITLKGPSHQTSCDNLSRVEIEKQWSLDGFTIVINELRKRIPSLMLKDYNNFHRATPNEVMKEIGLYVIQDRESQRKVKNIATKKDNCVVAELAIDYTFYNLNNHEPVGYYNIEIESKTDNESLIVKELTKYLIQMYFPDLKVWEHSKFATGKAIKKFQERGKLNILINSNNILKSSAYNMIDQLIKNQNI